MKRLKTRDWIEFEELSGQLVTQVNFEELPFKSAAAIVYLFKKQENPHLTFDEVLDMEDIELLEVLDEAADLLTPPNPTNGEASPKVSPVSA